jgi:adenylate cyclase
MMRFASLKTGLTATAVALALAWSALLASWHLHGRASLLDRFEATLADLRFIVGGPRPAPEDVVIVAIDDETVREAGRYPLSRTRMARLVRALAQQRPKAIALDVLFLDPAASDADQALADALRDGPAVIAAAAIFPNGGGALEDGGGLANVPVAERVMWPVERLGQAAGVGAANLSTDHSGTPRHVPLLVRERDGIISSLALRTIMVAAGEEAVLSRGAIEVGDVRIATDFGYHMPLRFYGPRGSIRTISAGPILRGEAPAAELRGRLVVVGATATGTSDSFATPFDPVLPGVEVLATAVGNIVARDALARGLTVRRADAAAAVVLAAAAVVLLSLRRIGLGLWLFGAGAAIWTAIAVTAFSAGIWLSMALPIAAALPPALVFVGARLALDRRTERRLETAQAALRRFHPPALADQLVAAPDFLLKPVQQEAAVLFIDLSGFTGVSERIGPEQTRDLLKGLHSVIEEEVTANGGLVLSFMGDGAMIVFGLPKPRPDDAVRALDVAVALTRKVTRWLDALAPDLRRGLGLRVGAHFGTIVASRLGGDTHHITVTGDCVNVASRLLEVAAQHERILAVSTELFDRAHASAQVAGLRFTHAREVCIRGRAQKLEVRFWSRGAVAQVCTPEPQPLASVSG